MVKKVGLVFHSNKLKGKAQCPSKAAGWIGRTALLEAVSAELVLFFHQVPGET